MKLTLKSNLMDFIIEGGVWFTIPILILGLGSLVLILTGMVLA
jgi:hypothetical protein